MSKLRFVVVKVGNAWKSKCSVCGSIFDDPLHAARCCSEQKRPIINRKPAPNEAQFPKGGY